MEPNSVPASAMMQPEKQKNKIGMIVGIAALALIAVVGAAFGAYAMVTKEQAVEAARNECRSGDAGTNCQNNNTASSDGTTGETTSETLASAKNAIIAAEAPSVYRMYYKGNYYTSDMKMNNLNITVRDGKVEQCYFDDRQQECTISGLEGRIYKVVQVAKGQDLINPLAGFIMEDGSVQYLDLEACGNNDDCRILGKLKIDGFVRDAVEVAVGSTDETARGGYGATVFVLDGARVIEYDESMK